MVKMSVIGDGTSFCGYALPTIRRSDNMVCDISGLTDIQTIVAAVDGYCCHLSLALG